MVRWLAIVGGVVVSVLLDGCVSNGGMVESYWAVHADRDSAVVLGALERSATASGGKQLGEAGPTGASFAFGNETLSFRVIDGSIIAYGTSVLPRPHPTERGRRSLNDLIERIVAAASRDSHVPMQLSTGRTAKQDSYVHDHASAQIVAANDRFKEYGHYLQHVVDAVQKAWDAVLANSNTYPPPGTWVSITFVLAPDGRITRIKNVRSHTTPTGENLALAGLTAQSPFDPWTAEMKAMLNPAGEELVFTFYYE